MFPVSRTTLWSTHVPRPTIGWLNSREVVDRRAAGGGADDRERICCGYSAAIHDLLMIYDRPVRAALTPWAGRRQ
jgi:hypothetical protein